MATIKEVKVPDIGGAKDVDVIELLVKPGDSVSVDGSLITLEGDKATMEIPAPIAGRVKEMKVKVGDKVSQGSLILTMETSEQAASDTKEETKAESTEQAASDTKKETKAESTAPSAPETPSTAKQKQEPSTVEKPTPAPQAPLATAGPVHAGPAVRRLAREFGVDLSSVSGSGEKNRITKEDLQQFVKAKLAGSVQGGAGLSIAPAPTIDFTQFGEISYQPLGKIQKITGSNLHRSWVTIPHVTQFISADITEMEAFREEQKAAAEKKGFKLTPLAFIMKAVVAALVAFPTFNSSLDEKGEQLILKKYIHLGVAVDTPKGLVVPVIRDVNCKSITELAAELAAISSKAREKGLALTDMQGGSFTISSLGGIGGTAFTPMINAPEVAILGVSKASIQPVYQNKQFVPRLMLPLSLSYDHRVINGAEAARFCVFLAERLTDIRTLLL